MPFRLLRQTTLIVGSFRCDLLVMIILVMTIMKTIMAIIFMKTIMAIFRAIIIRQIVERVFVFAVCWQVLAADSR